MSNFDERRAWSAPRVTTSGQITSRAKLIANEWPAHGSKPKIFGYMSIGESVPLVCDVSTMRCAFPRDTRLPDARTAHVGGDTLALEAAHGTANNPVGVRLVAAAAASAVGQHEAAARLSLIHI